VGTATSDSGAEAREMPCAPNIDVHVISCPSLPGMGMGMMRMMRMMINDDIYIYHDDIYLS
jgi:hypothetical protein